MRIKNLSLLVAISFSWISSIAQQGKVVDEIVAIVGKQTILLSEIENQVIQLRAQGYYSKKDIRCEVLESMLKQKLLVNQAILDSVEVSDAEVTSEMERRLNYFISQIGSEEKLEEFYGKSMRDIKTEFSEVIKDQILVQRMQQQLTKDINVTPQEVREYYNSLPKDSVPIINMEFELEQIAIYPQVKESEILRVKDQLRDFKTRIANGESMATLAVLYSEDPGSATKGGELGFVGRADLVTEFSAVAFNLKEGEVSKIVKTDYGYHIIQLIEKKGERINCRHILLKPKIGFEEKKYAQLKLDSVIQSISSKQFTFKEACWKYSEDENTKLNGGAVINPMTGNSRFEAPQLDPKTAYAIKNLNQGDISTPFETVDENGKTVYKVVRLKLKTEPHKADLKQDYQKIQDLTLNKKKDEFTDNWLKKQVKKTFIRLDDKYKSCDFENSAWKNL